MTPGTFLLFIAAFAAAITILNQTQRRRRAAYDAKQAALYAYQDEVIAWGDAGAVGDPPRPPCELHPLEAEYLERYLERVKHRLKP